MKVELSTTALDEFVKVELARLRRENTTLKGKVTRLESQVSHYQQQLHNVREADSLIRSTGDQLKAYGFTYTDWHDDD